MSQQLLPEENGLCHVVLVHGTWGRGFFYGLFWNWYSQNRKEKKNIHWPIAQKFQQSGIKVHTFKWSGKNSHYWRKEGGKELVEFLKKKVFPHKGPLGRVCIVAHSHGGNVALYALENENLQKNVDGLVFLSTPFLHCNPQTFNDEAFKLFPWAMAFVAATLPWVLALVLTGVGILFWFKNVDQLLLLYSQALMDQLPFPLFLIGPILMVLSLGFGNHVRQKTSQILSGLESSGEALSAYCKVYQPKPPPNPERTLIIRKTGDEASAVLATGRFIQWLLGLVWLALSWLVTRPKAVIRLFEMLPQKWHEIFPLLLSVGGLGVFVLSLYFYFYDKQAFDKIKLVLALSLVGFLILVILVCVVQIILLCLVIGLNFILFGRSSNWKVTPFLRLTSETTPEGSWKVELSPAQGFAHSEPYEDPKIIERVTKWVLESN